MIFFNDTATTEIYTLSLHDALPISGSASVPRNERTYAWSGAARPAGSAACFQAEGLQRAGGAAGARGPARAATDRKSTRLNSSHANLVCRLLLEKKKRTRTSHHT